MNRDERDEWDPPPPKETLPFELEDQPRVSGLLTELVFSAAGTVIFGMSSTLIREFRPVRAPSSPPPKLWQEIIYEWVPPLMFLLAFGCLVWLITIPMRMGALKGNE